MTDIVAVLLCAGLSSRFERGNKLLHRLHGRPLVTHAAETITSLPFLERIAVVGEAEIELRLLLHSLGFITVVNSRPESGKDSSLQLGIARAHSFDPEAVLVCLGDMPFVPADHLLTLAQAIGDERPAVSLGSDQRSPPCLFPKRFLGSFAEDEPVAGPAVLKRARDLALVPAPLGALTDIDTLHDLQMAETIRERSMCSA